MRWWLGLAFAGALAACEGSEPSSSGNAAIQANDRFTAGDVTVLSPLTSLDVMTPRAGLLPDDVASQIGMLVEHYTAEDTLERLRVVCTRFDPKGQLRLVLQPVIETNGVLGAQDATVHVFYDLDTAATRVMAQRLAARVEPSVVVRELVPNAALSRVTFMRNTDVKGNGWSFGGFDIAGSAVTPIVVGRVGGNSQNVIVNGSGPFATSLAPAPSGDATLGLLLDPVRLGILFDASPDSAKAQIDKGISAALALEDPAKFDNNTADCVSCHVAESARTFGAAKKSGIAAPVVTAAETLRACGYVGTKPMIAQRTKNESALAAQKMGELL